MAKIDSLAGRPIKEVVFLGNKVAETDYQKGVVAVAQEIVTDVFNVQNQKQRTDNINSLVNGISDGKFNTVSEVEKEINKSGGKNADVINTKSVLCDSLLLAMRDGGVPACTNALNTGDVSKIETALPRELRDWGRDVRNRHIDDTNITAILDQLSTITRFTKKEDKIKYLQNAGEKLLTLKNVPQEQLDLATNAIGVLFDQAENPTGNSMESKGLAELSATLKQSGDAQERLARQQLLFNDTMEKKWFSDQLMSKSTASSAPQLWYIGKPDWLVGVEKLEDWIDIFELAGAWSAEVTSRRKGFGGDFKNSFEDVQKILLNRGVIQEKFMKSLYENKNLGFKEALEMTVNELFVWEEHKRIKGLKGTETEYIEIPVFNYEKKENPTTKKLEWNKESPSRQVDEFLNDSGKYKKNLSIRLVTAMRKRGGVLANYSEEQAMIAVSLAMDFLELGGTFELADTFRKFDDGSDALRTALRPDRKLLAKVAPGKEPEIWGGPLMQAALAINKYDSEKAVDWLKRRGMLPGLLGACILNNEVVIDGVKISLGKALSEKKNIKFENTAKDITFGMKKDGQLPAIDLWLYLSGKKPLDLKAYGPEIDAVISGWSSGLRNSIKTAREYGVADVPDTLVAGAIAGSAGLWPVSYRHDGLYLRLPRVKGQIYTSSYGRYTSEIIRTLALSSAEIETLNKTFGIGDIKRMYLLDNLEALYSIETDGSIPSFIKKGLVEAKKNQIETMQSVLGIK